MRSYAPIGWIAFLLATMLLLPGMAVGGQSRAEAPFNNTVRTEGTNFTVNGTAIRLVGINDQTVIPFNLYPYPQTDFVYHNHLFPNYTGDPSTKIPSNNYTHFWWQYFWLVKDLGMNAVRLGAFSDWGLDMMHKTWYSNRTLWDSVIDPMLTMAEANGIYLIINLAGAFDIHDSFSRTTHEFGKEVPDPMSGSIYEVGSECYNHWVVWMGEVMRHYQKEMCIASWEIANEPDGDIVFNNYWRYLANPAASYLYWAETITTAVKAKDSHHLVSMGTGGGLFFGWGQGHFNSMNDNGQDFAHIHFYGQVEDEYLLLDRYEWTKALDKPLLLGEAANSDSAPPWGFHYWPWLDAMAAKFSVSLCWLVLTDYPGYPISNATMQSIPPVPSQYFPVHEPPPTQAVLQTDTITPLLALVLVLAVSLTGYVLLSRRRWR